LKPSTPIPQLRAWQCVGLQLISLLLASQTNPGMPSPWLAWCALVPLFIAIDRSSRARQAWLFGLWGLGWWCWSVWWLVPAAVQFIGLPFWLALLVAFAICFSLSAPYWLIGLFWRSFDARNGWASDILHALLFAFAAGVVPGVMPVALVSGQHVFPRLIQIVDIGGVPLLLFAAVLTNLLVARALTQCMKGGRRPVIAATIICALFIPLALWIYGGLRMASIDKLPATYIDIGWVQPNLRRDDSIDILIEQTRQLVAQYPEVDLVVWPEFPPAFSWSESADDRARVNALLQAMDKPLLLNSGYVFAERTEPGDNGGPRPYYNAAQLISAQGEMLGHYYKQRLVPFFEFLPFEAHFSTLRRWFPNSLVYVPGRDGGPIRFSEHVAIAPLICYEMIFPALVHNQIDNGANIFINPGNDGWFGMSRGSISHLGLALFRTVEHHRPWLRVTNSGISAAASASGELLMENTALQQRASGHVRLAIPDASSFYSRYPHAFLTVAGVLLLISGCWLHVARDRQT
jgi:apolipoprotein N-acyltransferase